MDGITSLRIDLPTALVEDAEKAGIDVANLTEETLRRELRQRRLDEQTLTETAESWAERNREAIESFRSYLDAQGGPFGDDYRSF